MRLLLDEMLAPAIAKILRDRGHDVIAISGSEHATSKDPEVLALARDQRRAIVTDDLKHFRPLHARAVQPGREGHHGMIFMPSSFPRSRADTGRIADALEELLNAHPGDDDLVNGEIWLRPE